MKEKNPTIHLNQATFVYYGEKQPFFASDLNGWREEYYLPFTNVEKGKWKFEIDLDQDAYLEYCFYINNRRVLDPFNNSKTSNGMGKYNNSFYMSGANPHFIDEYLLESQNPGKLEKVAINTQGLIPGKSRNIVIYTPANYTPDTPILIVLDGQDYLERAKINRIVDHLIENQTMQPITMVMIESKANSRTVEYTCSESNLLFITHEVIPYIEKITGILPIQERPGEYGILGASFGGLFAVFAGLRNPTIFGKVISQSGAFTIDQHPFVVWNLLDQIKTVPFDAYLDIGKYEWLLESNIEFFNQIKNKSNMKCLFHEFNAGHNYVAWQKDLPHCLTYMYPGIT